jgi:hypothetical protein
MTVNALTSTSASSPLASQNQAFRNADFLKIMLSELAHQDPMSPQDTSKIVENMQKLQELANTQFTKFRADVSWAQNLLGKEVNVQQSIIGEQERLQLVSQGLKPDVGYGSVTGKVDSFRQVGETVYVTVGDKDYPVDNIRQVVPEQQNNPQRLTDIASDLLGLTIGFYRETATDVGQGAVTNVSYGSDGEVMLTVGNEQVRYSHLQRIGLMAN